MMPKPEIPTQCQKKLLQLNSGNSNEQFRWLFVPAAIVCYDLLRGV